MAEKGPVEVKTEQITLDETPLAENKVSKTPDQSPKVSPKLIAVVKPMVHETISNEKEKKSSPRMSPRSPRAADGKQRSPSSPRGKASPRSSKKGKNLCSHHYYKRMIIFDFENVIRTRAINFLESVTLHQCRSLQCVGLLLLFFLVVHFFSF